MRYIRTKWFHTHSDEPIEIYSEIDEDGWEVRKIEIFPDGSSSYASSTEHIGTSGLAEVQILSLGEINADPQFQAIEISEDEFEKLWKYVSR